MSDADKQAALFDALAKAITDTRGVDKDGQGQGYLYARAENVMREADRVLTPNGIVVCPIGASISVAGSADSKNGARAIFSLTCKFLVAHKGGGSFVGEMTIAVGTNLAATPPQATSSAYTCCERDFYRALLRMPRGPEDDVEHPRNNRAPREEDDRPPAKPKVDVATTRKVNRVLSIVDAAETPQDYETACDRWMEVVHARTPQDDRGYSDADVVLVEKALVAANARVNR